MNEITSLVSSITPATPMEMLARALQLQSSPEVLEKLLALQERWERNESRKAFDQAMIKAAAEFEPIVKRNRASYGSGKTNYEYEDLAMIEQAVKPALNKYGIFYRHRPKVEANVIIVTCVLYGHGYRDEDCSLPAPADSSGSKNPVQAIGSTVTYLQRYTLRMALGLAPIKDDDATSTSNNLLSAEELDVVKAALDDAGAHQDDYQRFFKTLKITAFADLRRDQIAEAMQRIANFKELKRKQHATGFENAPKDT